MTYEPPLLPPDENGRPRNPRGRTGMTGRGLLGRWGPNHAADPIVTRRMDGRIEMVAIRRKDTQEWAIPGGMVDAGEVVSLTLRREFEEEAGNVPEQFRNTLKKLLDELFAKGPHNKLVYKGYVDDPRNTDNAWMETTAVHFHCNDELGRLLKLQAGDDAKDVCWLPVDEKNPIYANLYASHRHFVNLAVRNL